MRLRIALLTIALVALAAGVAYADQTIYATAPNQFQGGDVTIAQGEKVTFKNIDTVEHDVTAERTGSDGKPLFASEKVGTGGSAPVNGVEYLTTGSYAYICSIHPGMKGTITVSTEGKPAERPGGSGGGGGGGSGGGGSDTTAPQVSVKVLDTKRSKVRKRHALQLSITTNEAVSLVIKAKSGQTVIASGKASIPNAGTKKVSVKLTKAGNRAMKKKSVKFVVTVAAKDAAGNGSSASASGRLR